MKLFKKLALGGVIAAAGFLGACQGAATETGNPQELIVVQSADASSLDPHVSNDSASATPINHLFSRLVNQDEDLNIIPGLALSWEELDDRTWQFTLRDDVYFHNGDKLTAEDVVFSLKRAIASTTVTHIMGAFDPEGIEAVSEYVVNVATLEPFAPILVHLAHNASSILNERSVLEAGDDFGQNPVGTGPFAFKEWVSSDRIILERNDDFFGAAADFETLTFKIVPEAANRVIELETGQAHVALDILPTHLARVEADEALNLLRRQDLRVNYLGMNTLHENFQDLRVRQALNYAIDVAAIVDSILEGVGAPSVGPISPDVWGFNPALTGYGFDPERARALLAEAGFEDGFSTVLSIDDNDLRVQMATIIANQLGQVGIQVEIERFDWPSYLEFTGTGDHELFILGWTNVGGDADMGLFPTFHSSAAGPSGNRTFFANDRLDQLLEQGRAETNPEARKSYYFEAQEIIVAEAPWVFLNTGELLAATTADVEGFSLSPRGIHWFTDVTFR